MKKIVVMLVLMLSLVVSAFAEKQVIAVWDIANSTGYRFGIKVAQDFKAELTNALVNSGVYIVVERGQLNSVMDELAFQQTGMVNPATAVEIGRMAGAGLTLVGNVVTATVGRQDNVLYKSVKAKVKLNYKIVDNRTGVIKVSDMVEGNTSVMDSQRPDTDMLMFSAVKEAVEKVICVFDKLNPLSGSIMKFNGKLAYLNIGDERGVHVGDTFIVYQEGEVLRDPATGDILGVEDMEMGVLKVTEVLPKYCKAIVKKCTGKLDSSCKVKKVTKK